MENLINNLIESGFLKTPRIIGAFREIDRRDFMPESSKDLANLNEAMSIGYGQTISQPLVVAFMLELLQPKQGEKILDIGSGSGWTTALLSQIVGETGKVIAIEIIPELKDFGEKNTAKYNFVKKGIAKFVCTDGSLGYPKYASCLELAEGFDKILCSATAQRGIPPAWREQLKTGGRIAAPIGNSIWLFVKKSDKKFEKIEYPGFVFVPLVFNKK